MGVPSDSDSASSVNSKGLRKRPRQSADSGSDSARSVTAVPAPKDGAKKGGRGRPATTGKYAGIGLSRREAAAAMKAAAVAEKLEEDERQIGALMKRRATCLQPKPKNGRTVAAIRRVSKVSKGLSGCTQKALKEATASILESAQVLLTRTTTEETALLRAQNAKLAAQMTELRKEHEELKAEMANFRREHLRRGGGPSARNAAIATAVAVTAVKAVVATGDGARLIRQEMASFDACFSVLEGRILRPPLAIDQRSTPAPTYATQAAAPRAAQPAQAAAATLKRMFQLPPRKRKLQGLNQIGS
ncbi:unnamed protein product [Arctia plantaginis]|uniref:Uncharacterized protein n=1 Tax=Arctia plantaginis TaxID=874455 RepID=A0A8S1AZ92_ARCPL|nr:unnamed protein product [Arctia plantaginis]